MKNKNEKKKKLKLKKITISKLSQLNMSWIKGGNLDGDTTITPPPPTRATCFC
jgi:natural product precursor